MADKKEENPPRTTETRPWSVQLRSILHDGVGSLPGFAGMALDWGAGLLRSSAYLMVGKLERPDYFANGPADRSLTGSWGVAGSAALGQPMAEGLWVGDVRSRTVTDSLKVEVSFDAGKKWDRASGGETAAHYVGQFIDPTLALPFLAGAKTVGHLSKAARITNSTFDKVAFGTLGLVVGDAAADFVINPDQSRDLMKLLSNPNGLDTPRGINKFNQKINTLLKEHHDPMNNPKDTSTFLGMGTFENKNADPRKKYYPSLDPQSGTLQTKPRIGDNPAELSRNYSSAAQSMQVSALQAHEAIASGKGVIRDYEIAIMDMQLEKRLNDISSAYLTNGPRTPLSTSDMTLVQMRLAGRNADVTGLLVPQRDTTLTALGEYLQSSYKTWSQSPEGQEAIKKGIQTGALNNLDKNAATIPNNHLNFMLQTHQNTLGQEIKSAKTGLTPLLEAEAQQIQAASMGTFGIAPPITPGR